MERLMSKEIQELVANTVAPAYLGTDCDGEDVIDFYTAFEGLVEESVKFEYGATKIAFILKDSDYVLKIPFNCSFDEYSEFEDEIILYEDDYPDYCQKEADIYQDVCKNHPELKGFFAETFFYGTTKDGTPVYAQKKVHSVCANGYSSYTEESLETINSEYQMLPINRYWLASSLDFYGREAIDSLLSYLDDSEINDLHSSNIGYYANGQPVMFDYSGFYQ